MREREPIEFDRLMTDTDVGDIDPSACPNCDGTLVPDGPIEPTGDDSGRVDRHCSRCETTPEQHWELTKTAIVEGDTDETFETRLDNCPNCGGSLTSVGNFFDHRDGSGRQERACTDCAVELDEWWEFHGSVTGDTE